jgi:15-cis-phytoene synthase
MSVRTVAPRRPSRVTGDLVTAEALERCIAITRAEARNFHYGIRLLPPRKRAAMSAVYAFARRADDVGDGAAPPGEKLAALSALRDRVVRGVRPAGDPMLVALAWARREFDLPEAALLDLLDGIESDVRWAGYGTWPDLERYCRRVAGSVGRLSVAVFGARDRDAADRLADDLGVAMQLTNVLRDVREDLAVGRCYLPAEDLRRAGIDGDPGPASPRALAAVLRFEAERADRWFRRGLRLLPLLDARSAACVSAMAGIYRRILRRLVASPEEALAARVSLPAWEKAWVAARSLAGVSP